MVPYQTGPHTSPTVEMFFGSRRSEARAGVIISARPRIGCWASGAVVCAHPRTNLGWPIEARRGFAIISRSGPATRHFSKLGDVPLMSWLINEGYADGPADGWDRCHNGITGAGTGCSVPNLPSKDDAGQVREKLAPAAFRGRPHSILNNSRMPIDFWPQRTDPRAFPLKAWRRLVLHSLATAGHSLTEYGDPRGLAALRTAIADHVASSRGIYVRPEQVIVVAGAQLALNLALRVLAHPGDSIVVENPCNQGAAFLFESLSFKVHPIPVDQHGIDTSKLSGINAQIVHVMPSHQYPMGGTLSAARRT